MRPYLSIISSTNLFTCEGSDTSNPWFSDLAPIFSTSVMVFLFAAFVRAHNINIGSSFASDRAVAAPMPRLAPVRTTTLSF